MPTPVDRRLRVFLCHIMPVGYAKEDKPTVRELYRQLTSEGWLDVWLDEMNLLPNQTRPLSQNPLKSVHPL